MLSIEEWRSAYRAVAGDDLMKRGQEFVGPCPNCGGDDRFAIKESNGKVLANCRGCGDFYHKLFDARAAVAVLKGLQLLLDGASRPAEEPFQPPREVIMIPKKLSDEDFATMVELLRAEGELPGCHDEHTATENSNTGEGPHCAGRQSLRDFQADRHLVAAAAKGPPYRKHGRAVRYFLSDVIAWSDSKRVG